MKVLVGYASRHGATKGIAERISETLGSAGLEVTLAPVADAGRVKDYDAFVIGSAAYMGRWMSEATTFVHRHQDVLASRPVWLFSSGPIGNEPIDAKGRDQLVASRPKDFDEFARTIQPRDQRVFFGAYDPNAKAVGLAEGFTARFLRVMPSIKNAIPAGDYRDWPAIEAWAEGIARDLRPVGATS